MPTAIDISSVVGLIALGMFTAQILIGLLLSVGYNPIRQWPRQRWIKLFTFHNWLGYIGLATAFIHPLILLASSDGGLPAVRHRSCRSGRRCSRFPTTLGAIAFYLIAFVVLTSYFRRVFGRHRWKQLHYTAYAAAAVFYVHGVLGGSAAEEPAGGFHRCGEGVRRRYARYSWSPRRCGGSGTVNEPPASVAAARRTTASCCFVSLKRKPHLELEHPRRIDVRERRDRVGRGAGADQLTERRVRRAGVAVGRLPAAEDVAVVEEVEALQPQQDRAARRLDATLDEESRRPACAVPRNADLPMTLPSTTGRSLFAPSPLLSTPVVALNGRADASCVTVPAVMLYGNW